MEEQMDKKIKQSKSGMLASDSQIVIKQQMNAPTRYSGALAPASEIVIKQQESVKDARY